MNKHILLALDGSNFSKKSISYLSSIFPKKQDLEITVFSLAPKVPTYLATPNPALDEITRQERIERIERQNLTKAQKIVEEAIEELKKAGFPEKNLHSKFSILRGDIASALLREARSGKYDALVIGRRGLGRLASAWMGSVSQKVVEYGQGVPVWVISGQEWNPRFLVAVDLGDPGNKVIDYISFILSGIPQAEIVLFHVIGGLLCEVKEEDLEEIQRILAEREQEEAARFFEKAKKLFLEEGFDPSQIRVKLSCAAFGPGGSIIKEAREGDFGTVVVGRRGLGGFKGLLLGSVSSKVLFNLNDRAIWVVG